jgi:hypothetical protein
MSVSWLLLDVRILNSEGTHKPLAAIVPSRSGSQLLMVLHFEAIASGPVSVACAWYRRTPSNHPQQRLHQLLRRAGNRCTVCQCT